MDENLTIPKNPREKCVTLRNNILDIYGERRHKTALHQFSLSTDDPVSKAKGSNSWTYFQTLGFKNVNSRFSNGHYFYQYRNIEKLISRKNQK